MNFDHIGIFVKTLAEGRTHFQSLLKIKQISEEFYDHRIKVAVQFLYDEDGICYEIIAPYLEGNPVDHVLLARKNVLNHVAYRVRNFNGLVEHYRNNKCAQLGPPLPAIAFGGRRVVFFLTPLNIIIELIEDKIE
jgi:methylmalonyl-CoA/ethylmalonyl-CoA epimerase